MLRSTLVLLLAAVIAIALGTINVSGQAPDKPRPGFLSALKTGQGIMFKEVAGRFEVSMFDDDTQTLSHKVIEVGTDFLTIEDIGGLTETRLPIYSIKSIVRLKVPKK